jgi:hypothetical protein
MFFEIFAIFQVWYFSLQLFNIISHHVKVFHCFYRLSIYYAHLQLWLKRRAWTFLAWGWTSLNLQWISDEIADCESKKDFSKKKSWALDHVHVIQSDRLPTNLAVFFLFLEGRTTMFQIPWLGNCACKVVYFFIKKGGTIVKLSFGGCFTKHTVFRTRK